MSSGSISTSDLVNSTNSINGTRATSRGTEIVKAGSDMSKDAFLKILTAELSNQDPENAKDSTQYVSQMAQFTSLEQMSNLNSTMTMSSANSMIGKNITLNVADSNGNLYTGTVKNVTKQYGQVKVGVEVEDNGQKVIKDFNFDEVTGVNAVEDSNAASISSSMNLISAASLIGKNAEFDNNGTTLSGIIKGVTKDGTSLKFTILDEYTGQVSDVTPDKIKDVFSL